MERGLPKPSPMEECLIDKAHITKPPMQISSDNKHAIKHPSLAEGLGGRSPLSLYELNSIVRELIETQMPNEYWVEAELSECRESRGHCYMELIQRDDHAATPIAKASAKCWASKWQIIRPYFERITGQQVRAGMKVLLQVYPQFHETYGFSWIITDIDPNYTLGDQARRRQEIIRQLKEEGVFDLQRELCLPQFCLNIAVISSQTAAGYGDFAAQLTDSPFAFHAQLFPAIMQGEGIEQSVIAALEQIYNYQLSIIRSANRDACQCNNNPFDAVVIIRGGGATSDMSGFDTLALAENVANFPIPIITGIGHDRDECILDMVSHLRVKTPTAAAAFLIDRAQIVLDSLNEAQNRLVRTAQQTLITHNAQLLTLQQTLPRLFSVVKTRQEARIDRLFSHLLAQARQTIVTNRSKIVTLEQRIPIITEYRTTSERHKLELIAERMKALDPTLLLRRGYSITRFSGHALRNPQQLREGDEIETIMEKGTIISKVIIKSNK